MKITDVGAAYDPQFLKVEVSDKLRAAAKAAYRAMVAMELSDGSKREWDTAIAGLRAALAEPAIKESLTVQCPWVGLTDEDISQWIEEEHDVLRWAEAKLKERNT